MVKIIRMPPVAQPHEFTCSCLATLEASPGEGKAIFDQRDGNHVIFTCPLCKAQIYVSMALLKAKGWKFV